MTYKINGVEILQPTSGQWTPRRALGLSGEGRDIYPAVREFRLRWQLMPISDFNQIWSDWEDVSSTGTAVVELPDLEAASYVFREFSGVHLQEPTLSEYFQEHVRNVVLVLTNIKT